MPPQMARSFKCGKGEGRSTSLKAHFSRNQSEKHDRFPDTAHLLLWGDMAMNKRVDQGPRSLHVR